jgi:hypothetical protein
MINLRPYQLTAVEQIRQAYRAKHRAVVGFPIIGGAKAESKGVGCAGSRIGTTTAMSA